MQLGGQAFFCGIAMRRCERAALAVSTNKGIEVSVRSDKKCVPKARFLRGLYPYAYAFRDSFLLLYEWLTLKSGADKRRGLIKAILFYTALAAFIFAAVCGVCALYDFAAEKLLPVGLDSGLFDAAFFAVLLSLAVLIMRLLPPVRRLFRFHAAEHMVINCVEAGEKPTVDNARTFSRIHPRCGTVIVTSIIITALILAAIMPGFLPEFIRELTFIVGMTVSVIITRRLVKGSGKSRLCRLLIWPGLAAQKITTLPPENIMLECAVLAAKALLTPEPSCSKAAKSRTFS